MKLWRPSASGGLTQAQVEQGCAAPWSPLTKREFKMRPIFAWLFVAALFPQGVLAKGFVWQCALDVPRSSTGWVSPYVVVGVQADGQVFVVDAMLLDEEQSPAKPKVLRNTETALTLQWQVLDVVDSLNQSSKLVYELRLNKRTGRVRVNANPVSYSNSFSGRGRCIKKDE